MSARRSSQAARTDTASSRQLALAIEQALPRERSTRRARPAPEKTNAARVVSDPILWMPDIVALTGKHRCTIHRWIQQGSFPKKDAPKERPRGWLHSTYERWLHGNSDHAT
jgi:predicted DNA-binding transcriptional regulator AlpA